MSRIKN